ncbi:aminotransferase class I/II-fold pyridoxal phosphate-dependent enzyme [Bacillus sp. 165]|uniref:aminotransferase class I/II-fold pyridoxal phosphate-dependent enzyme n=1 Tax=Bacillus sp. 165 TaxID=1529117 RepID=UPI001ADC9A06|nr:aminotransferase class I/II-fold pyridoxal phosphate-dependent enzyme [Bacillus sp. 165]MBO9131279.1 aminotransferase class I/II-fold pyridoxal phosphate-dependent enzyme [Bacillus sp. 165]
MGKRKLPLYEELVAFAKRKPYSFHVPGHKNGKINIMKRNVHYYNILKIDVTELTGLDDLHDPSSCIEEAQKLTAIVYDVQNSYFLVNGSTVGNLAMVLAVCEEDDVVLVQRNCHKSIMNALQLVGVKPIFLSADIDEQAQVPVGVSYEIVQAALQRYPQAKALILTHPNYYGMSINLEPIIEAAHAQNIPVLVDEAHGAHFCIGDPFPRSALAYGADIVVHSAHKTLPAMTMGAYLHINSSLIDSSKVENCLSMLQSSSPSYPIMASLDIARAFLEELKEIGTEEVFSFLYNFRTDLCSIPQIQVLEHARQDWIKITIQSRCSLSGYELQQVLEREGIYTELADPLNVLLVLPLEVQDDYKIIINKIKIALESYPILTKSKIASSDASKANLTIFPYSYKELKKMRKETILLKEAQGRIAAEQILPYPPGIPLIMNGERITKEHIKSFNTLKSSGARFQGFSDEERIEVYIV